MSKSAIIVAGLALLLVIGLVVAYNGNDNGAEVDNGDLNGAENMDNGTTDLDSGLDNDADGLDEDMIPEGK